MSHSAPAVRLDRIRAGYPGVVVLDGLSTEVAAGATTAVLGPNGAGKSTLLDVIAGTLPPLAGSVTRSSSRRPAYVVQRNRVSDTLPITARAAVAMGRWAHRGPWRRLRADDHRVVDECLERLGLTALAGRGLGTLSGGQRQRVLVAQALAQRAELLLLDEPAVGLDVEARDTIDRVLHEAVSDAGVTVVRVTHDPESARRADHRLVLRDGAVVDRSTRAPGWS